MSNAGEGGSSFGSCCEALKEVLETKEFDPLMAVGDDGVLYMSIGMLDAEGGEANVIDHPVFFCPFCGSELQTEEDVEAKSGGADGQS
jgi:hypothetical protein